MMRPAYIAVLVAVLIGLFDAASGLAAAPRIALVIGNSGYQIAPPLANPANDARLMAETLRDLGFDVIERIDADRDTMLLATFELQDKLIAAGTDAVGLFFYAGHGVQVGGENYLIPLKVDIKQEREVPVKTVSASFVLSQMEFAGNNMNFVILDACRNNPFPASSRAATRGLARMQAPKGSLVAYSTGPGEVAVDGTGDNSPYVLALARAMRMPGLPAELMFKRVRDAVLEATNGEQTPWEETSLQGGEFYFTVDVSVTVEAPGTPATSDTAAATQQETVFWESIEDSTDPAMFEAYLEQYPKGAFARLAALKRDLLSTSLEAELQVAAVVPPPEPVIKVVEMDAIFVVLKTSNVRSEPTIGGERVGRLMRDSPVTVTGKIKDGNWYRILYENREAYVFGDLIAEVDLAELTAWQEAAESDDADDLAAFIEDYPDGRFAERAEAILAQVPTDASTGRTEMAFWGAIKNSTNPDDYRAYLQAYPNGVFAELARRRAGTSTRVATLSPQQRTQSEVYIKEGVRVINIQTIRDLRGREQPILVDILRNTLQALPNAVVISEPLSDEDDVVVSGSILKFALREEANPEYLGAQLAAQLFGGLVGALAKVNVAPSHIVVDVEVLIAAQDNATGRSYSESGYANLKIDSRQVNPKQAAFDALQTAVTQAAKRIVIRLTGGTPPRQVTAEEIRNDPNLRNEIIRFYDAQRFWRSYGGNRPTDMVEIYDISLASVSDEVIKLDVKFRWKHEDKRGTGGTGRNASGVATVQRAGSSFRVISFE